MKTFVTAPSAGLARSADGRGRTRRPAAVPDVVSGIPRGPFFGALATVGLANALTERTAEAIAADGFVQALVGTFGVSALVWIAAYVCIALLGSAPAEVRRPSDMPVAVVAAAVFCIPSSLASWLAVSGIALHLIRSTEAGSPMRRGATILLALTVPCFWSKALFAVLSGYILALDAVLVSTLIGTARAGNTFLTADGAGVIWIAPACSSLANVSLAVLCWVLVSRATDRGTVPSSGALWCLLAACGVVAVNVGRMALVGLEPALYGLVHEGAGSVVAGWLTLAVMLGICLIGVRHERVARI